MATVPLVTDDGPPAVSAVFDDIRATRSSAFVNNFWRALAFDPGQLAEVWGAVKRTMAPGALDPLTKEMIYIAVSTANSCAYCVHSHTAAARAKGLSEAQHAELVAVIALAARTNHLANALQIPIDPVFDRAETQ